MSILSHITHRKPVDEHDGRSGASIETGVLDGARVYVKTVDISSDAGQLLTGDARRELRLFEAGVFDALPDQVGNALVAVEDLGDRLVTVTRDLGSTVLRWDRILAHDEVRRIFGAIVAAHEAFVDLPTEGLCPLARRLSIFAPANLPALGRMNADLAEIVSRGHDAFAELVPDEIVDVVHGFYEHPESLAQSMDDSRTTLLHGDFFLPNVALDEQRVTPLDWGLATAGPSSLDLITFCVGAMSNVDLDRTLLLAEARAACRELVDDATFQRTELWALMELGWNKAIDAVDHPSPAKRATELADLEFWVERARRAIDAGVIPPTDRCQAA